MVGQKRFPQRGSRRSRGNGPSSRREDGWRVCGFPGLHIVAVPVGTALHRGTFDAIPNRPETHGRRSRGNGPSSRLVGVPVGPAGDVWRSPFPWERPFIEASTGSPTAPPSPASPFPWERPFIEASAPGSGTCSSLPVAVPVGTALHRGTGGAATGEDQGVLSPFPWERPFIEACPWVLLWRPTPGRRRSRGNGPSSSRLAAARKPGALQGSVEDVVRSEPEVWVNGRGLRGVVWIGHNWLLPLCGHKKRADRRADDAPASPRDTSGSPPGCVGAQAGGPGERLIAWRCGQVCQCCRSGRWVREPRSSPLPRPAARGG